MFTPDIAAASELVTTGAVISAIGTRLPGVS